MEGAESGTTDSMDQTFRFRPGDLIKAAKTHSFDEAKAHCIAACKSGDRLARAYWHFVLTACIMRSDFFGWEQVEAELREKEWIEVPWAQVDMGLGI